MIAVSQNCISTSGRLHGRGVRIDGADPVIRDALVMRFTNPIDPFAIVFSNQSAKRGESFFKELVEMLLGLIFCPVDHPVNIRVGLHLRAVEVQLLSPDQSSFNTQFHNVLKEQLEHIQSKTFTNFA